MLIASVTAAQYLAWLAFGPFSGAIVDRAERRRTILITQLWRGLLMAGLGLLVWSGHAQTWHVCVAFASTLGEILVDPSTVALVPTLVDDAELDRANGRIAGDVHRVTGRVLLRPAGHRCWRRLRGSFAGARVASVLGTRATLSGCVALQGITLATIALAPSVPVVAALWLLTGSRPGCSARSLGACSSSL